MALPSPGLKKKDPQAVLDYAVDWGDWLTDAPTPGDSLDSSSWTIPSDLTVESEGIVGDLAIVWLSGGTVGEEYQLTNHIVTADGREDDCSFNIRIENQ